jgi:DNA-binding transcriptional MerR regulator
VTGALLDLAELAARAEMSVERLRHYADVELLPPARLDGDRLGYSPAEAHTMRLVAGWTSFSRSGGVPLSDA